MAVIYEKIAIIGMGLIGASIAHASRRAGLATVMVIALTGPDAPLLHVLHLAPSPASSTAW